MSEPPNFDDYDDDQLSKLRAIYVQNRDNLEVQIAGHGHLNVPLTLLNQFDYEKKQIALISAELKRRSSSTITAPHIQHIQQVEEISKEQHAKAPIIPSPITTEESAKPQQFSASSPADPRKPEWGNVGYWGLIGSVPLLAGCSIILAVANQPLSPMELVVVIAGGITLCCYALLAFLKAIAAASRSNSESRRFNRGGVIVGIVGIVLSLIFALFSLSLVYREYLQTQQLRTDWLRGIFIIIGLNLFLLAFLILAWLLDRPSSSVHAVSTYFKILLILFGIALIAVGGIGVAIYPTWLLLILLATGIGLLALGAFMAGRGD